MREHIACYDVEAMKFQSQLFPDIDMVRLDVAELFLARFSYTMLMHVERAGQIHCGHLCCTVSKCGYFTYVDPP